MNLDAAAYDIYVCVRCTNGQDSQDMNGWRFILNNACSSSMTAPAKTDVTLAYAASSAAEAISPQSGVAWVPDTVFSNTIAGCEITSCTLYDAGCTTAYSGSEVTFSTSSITAIKTDIDGYA